LKPVKDFLASKIKLFVYTRKVSLNKATLAKIEDAETKILVRNIILNTEKQLGSDQSIAKFEYAKKRLLKVVPDLFDELAGSIIQAVFDGMRQQSEI